MGRPFHVFGAQHFHIQNDLRIKRENISDLVESVIFSLELGLSLHQDVETSKGGLVIVIPDVEVLTLPLENLGILSPPDFPLPTFSYHLDVFIDPWEHRGNLGMVMGVLWG